MKRAADSMELKTTVSKEFFLRWCPNPERTHKLGDLYAEFNAKFFGGELPVLRTVEKEDEDGETTVEYPDIKWDGRLKRAWGMYKPNHKGSGVIRLSRSMVAGPIQVKSTLLHEMLHKWLDLKGMDSGIKGHGPTFINKAREINKRCKELKVPYRVHFYDEEITKEQPEVYSDLLMTTIYCTRDLDVSRQMGKVFRAAFDKHVCRV